MTSTEPTSGAAGEVARVQTRISVADPKIMVNLLGAKDEILRLIERALVSDVHVRGNEITVTGAPADNALAERLFAELIELIEKGETLTVDAVRRTLSMIEQNTTERPAEVLTLNILSRRGRTIRPKTLGQKRYVDAIDENTIVFGIGPAGTGKTYLAMAKAVQALQAKQVSRIILTRPAVEAGERLGFLPGTLNEKIDPYLRPLYDALHDMLDPESIPRLMQAGTIEVAPLAYMRGRAQPLTAKVLTPDGWRRIGDLTVGDLVVASDGLPTPVLGVYPQGRKKIYRVTTQDGAATLACGEHLWTVRTPDDRGWRVVQTQDMIGHRRRYELPLVDPVEFAPQDVPVEPYAMGQSLGGGEPAAVGAGRDLAATATVTAVPEAYLFNSAAVRRAVLQGILDGGTRPWTGSAQLAEDVMFLVRSLGGIAFRRPEAGGFAIDIELPEGGLPMRFVEAIEPVGRMEAVCIQVAAADSLYVTDDLIVTHNTLNDAFIILDEAQNTTPEQMKMFLTRLGFASKIVVTGDVTQVDLPGGTSSGLRVVRDILTNVEDVHFSQLTSSDVVRHRLVAEIVDAYERYDAKQQQQSVHAVPERAASGGRTGRRR
jgi:phosphate starvation-inducible PhoH-like protein